MSNANLGMSVAGLVAVAVLVLIINAGMQSALHGGGAADMGDAAVAERIAPVAQLNTGEPMQAEAEPAAAPAQQAAAAGARSGEEVYNSSCVACHNAGVAGAPKLGDAAAWAPRIEQGMEVLMNSAMNGKGAMPPKGTCATCSREEIQNAIDYMVSNSQ